MAAGIVLPRETWNSLDARGVRGEELVARRLELPGRSGFFCAVKSNGSRHFLIPVDDATLMPADDRSRGLRARILELFVSGEPPSWYIDIECVDRDMHDLFDAVGEDLIRALSASASSAEKVVQLVLAKWRRFWADIPNQILSDEEIVGLFGELWFLQVWLAPAVGHQSAIASWRGPFGARHDFQGVGLAVEAKATRSVAGRVHRINGVDQLALPDAGGLCFFSLKVQKEIAPTNSLPLLIGLIRAAVVDDPESASAFDNALAKSGYSDAHNEHYQEHRFRVVDSILFDVGPAFPALTRASFSAGNLPPGVVSIWYEIDLEGNGAARITERPEEAREILRRMTMVPKS